MMNSQIRSLSLLLCMLLTPVYAHEDKEQEGDNGRIIHLTKYNAQKIAVETTDENITVWTKEDPFKAKDSDLIYADVELSSKISKGAGAVLDIYVVVDGNKEKLGDVLMKPIKHTYEGSNETVTKFTFSMTKKYFEHARVRIGTDAGVDYEFIELHLHTKR